MRVLNILNLLIFWPVGFYLLFKGCGWFGCAGVFVLLFANNVQHYITSHAPKDFSGIASLLRTTTAVKSKG